MYKEILKNIFASVFDKKEQLFKALLIPTLLLMVFDYFLVLDFTNLYITIPFFILMMLINITISITTHRILLLKKSDIPTWGLFKLGSREYKFTLSSGGLGLILLATLIIGAIVLGVMGTILKSAGNLNIFIYTAAFFLFIYMMYVATRLSMVFPSIAVDKALTFKQSWKYTQKYKLLCFITIVVFPLLFAILISLVYGLVIKFLMTVISSELAVLYSLLNVFINVFIISALSVTYEYVIANVDQTDELLNDVDPNKIYKLSINDYDIIQLDSFHDITFESLKNELISQYEKLGYINAVMDKTDSWVVKQDEVNDSYVALRVTNEEYQIQTFNTDEPILSILKSSDSRFEI